MAEAATQPEKFLFETVFDTPVTPNDAEISEERLTAIREEAYQAGFNAAQTQSANTLNIIASTLKTFDQNTADIKNEAVSLAIITARKLATTLLALHPIAEVEALIHEALNNMPKDIHLHITVNEKMSDEIRAVVEALPEAQFMTGKIIIEGAAGLAANDCRLKWAEGEITRDTTGLTQQIDAIIANYLSGTPAGEQYRAALEETENATLADEGPKQESEPVDE